MGQAESGADEISLPSESLVYEIVQTPGLVTSRGTVAGNCNTDLFGGVGGDGTFITFLFRDC